MLPVFCGGGTPWHLQTEPSPLLSYLLSSFCPMSHDVLEFPCLSEAGMLVQIHHQPGNQGSSSWGLPAHVYSFLHFLPNLRKGLFSDLINLRFEVLKEPRSCDSAGGATRHVAPPCARPHPVAPYADLLCFRGKQNVKWTV